MTSAHMLHAEEFRDWPHQCRRARLHFSRSPAPTISAKGFGDADPVASNDTPKDSAQNRRVELSVHASGAEISASPYNVGGKDVIRHQQSNGAAPAPTRPRVRAPRPKVWLIPPGVQARAVVVRTARGDDSAIEFSSSPPHKFDPDAFGLPDRFHFGARLGLVHPKYVAAKAIEERRDPSVGDAVHVHLGIL